MIAEVAVVGDTVDPGLGVFLEALHQLEGFQLAVRADQLLGDAGMRGTIAFHGRHIRDHDPQVFLGMLVDGFGNGLGHFSQAADFDGNPLHGKPYAVPASLSDAPAGEAQNVGLANGRVVGRGGLSERGRKLWHGRRPWAG